MQIADEDLECHNEIWDAIDQNSNASDSDDVAPKLPTASSASTDEEIKAKGIIGWTTGFLLSLQAK